MRRVVKWSGLVLACLIALVLLAGGAGMLVDPAVSAEASVAIQRPQAEVFGFLADPRNLCKWAPEIRTVESMGGNRYRYTGPGGEAFADYQPEPPDRLRSTLAVPSIRLTGDWDITIDAAQNGSVVRSRARMNVGNPWMRLMFKVMNADDEERKTLEALKKHLEGAD